MAALLGLTAGRLRRCGRSGPKVSLQPVTALHAIHILSIHRDAQRFCKLAILVNAKRRFFGAQAGPLFGQIVESPSPHRTDDRPDRQAGAAGPHQALQAGSHTGNALARLSRGRLPLGRVGKRNSLATLIHAKDCPKGVIR